MLRLKTLGPTELRTEGGEDLRAVLAQPKRLGLLVYLAVEAPDRFVRRDTLLALFWPELDETQARQALRSALYFLRQHLGDQVLTSRGADELGASSAALRTDATEFLRAAERGDAEAALSLYQGDFLAGLHIPDGSAELDQWMSHTRLALQRRAAELAWSLAGHAERDRNPAGAAHWGRRAQEVEADDEGSLRRLMELLDRSGDPGGALRAYEEFAGRLKAELSVAPSAATGALVDRLRSRRPSPPPTRRVPEPTAKSGPGAPTPALPPAPPRRGLTAAGILFGALLVAVMAALFRRGERAPLPVAGPVVVAAFRNETGDTALAIWGRYAGDWITQGLQAVGRMPVVPWTSALRASRFVDSISSTANVDPVSLLRRETGASTVITGSYYRVNDSYRIRAEVTDARTGKLLFSVPGITATQDSIEPAIRELGERLLGGIGLALDRRFEGDPRFGIRPPRFAAFAVYEHGYDLFRVSNYDDAVVEFLRAFALDSSFITPALAAATVYLNQRRYAQLDTMVRTVASRRESLTEFQQLTLAHLEAQLRGDGQASLAALQRGSLVAPNSGASYNLALNLIGMGHPNDALRALNAMDPASGLVNSWALYWIYLAHANHLVGNHDEELQAVREVRRRFPDRSVGLVLEVSALAALNRTAALDSVFSADASNPNTYWSSGAALVMAGEELMAHGHPERAGSFFARAIDWLRLQLKTDARNRYHRDWLAAALYQTGRWEEARPVADSLAAEFPNRYLYRTMSALLAARRGDTAGARLALGDAVVQNPGPHLAARARIAAILGDADRAATLLREALDRGVSEFQFAHADWRVDFERMSGDPRIRRLLVEGLDRGNRPTP